jgi:S-adenosylmethionine:tRNA ribosyltransferase-isomerase
MKVSDFDFDLPDDRIATHPVEPRDACKLLQVSKFFFDFEFHQLPDLLNAGDILVLNDSKVIPARLFAKKGDVNIELLLHKPSLRAEGEAIHTKADMDCRVAASAAPRNDETIWLAFAKPGKKVKIGDTLTIADDFKAEVLEKRESGEVLLSFNVSGDAFFAALDSHGHMPLPPYIKREDDKADQEQYQTVYADAAGSVAAPTAGLHFTPELLAKCEAKGIQIARLTLHVGAGTFQPVKVEDTKDHIMHSEWAEISADTAAQINAARAGGGKVVAVGTTAMRTLESAADDDGTLKPFCDETDIFITPGYEFKIVDRLVTNFHLPKSTLFMLVSAFCGTERMKAAYHHAIHSDYRFYSYGDACLLDRAPQSVKDMPHVGFL